MNFWTTMISPAKIHHDSISDIRFSIRSKIGQHSTPISERLFFFLTSSSCINLILYSIVHGSTLMEDITK